LGRTQQTGLVKNDDRADWTVAYKLFPGDVAYIWYAGVHAAEVAANLEAAGFRIRAQIVCLRGADNYDSLRGDGLDFVVLDEYASISRAAWTEVLRPALADREGGALFIGTPQGFNHFHELVESAEGQPDWEVFQYTTAEGGNVSPKELESAAHELDERTYLQEFEARFATLGVGRAYYAFDRAHHVGNFRFNPHTQLCWSLDFNMNRLCSVLAHVQENGGVAVLEGLILPDSDTAAACEEFLSRTAKWFSGTPLAVCVYGDSTGEQRRTSASRTDWQIVKDFFGRYQCEAAKSCRPISSFD
jgi:hypothetical protein